jgi:hypothetical protein
MGFVAVASVVEDLELVVIGDRLLQNPPKLICKGSNDVYFADVVLTEMA